MLTLNTLQPNHHEWFIRSLQKAFKLAVAHQLAKNEEIISRSEIEAAMQAENAQCLEIAYDGQLVAGAVVKINPTTQHNVLELFFVETHHHGKGIGIQA